MQQIKRILAVAASAAAVGVLVACSATPVTPEGAGVEIVTEQPANCRTVGEVIGSQGNVFSGDFTTDQTLMQGARNDLRNKAAALGGNVVQLQGAHNSTHPYSAGAIKSTLIGVVFACPGR